MMIRKATFGLMMAASFALAGHASANVLVDGSFEAVDTSGGDQPAGNLPAWGQFNDAFVSSQSAPPQDGNNVIKIFGPFTQAGAGAGVFQGGFAATAGQEWTASAYA